MSKALNAEEGIPQVASKLNELDEKGGEDDMNELEELDENEGGDDEENDGDIGEYVFMSEEEIEPLAVIEDDAILNQTYQQFECPENQYEALAAKKRKALVAQDSQRESLVRKLGLDDITGVSIDELMDDLNYGRRRKSRKYKKRGRRKGSKNKLSPEITRKIGDANVHYAHNRYEEAIRILYEIVRIATHLPDPYHTLGLVHYAMGDKMKALDFYMLAANLSPRDAFRWEIAVPLCIELEKHVLARNCLKKAITANPEDITLRLSLASLYEDFQDYQKAAEVYDQILNKFPRNSEALTKATMLYRKCGQKERSAVILEEYLRCNPIEADGLSIIDLLTTIYVKIGEHAKALQHILNAKHVYCGGKELPPDLAVKEGICYGYLGDTEKAEIIFSKIKWENLNGPDLLCEVADLLMTLNHYETALKYLLTLESDGQYNSGSLHKNIAYCYLNVKEKRKAIEYMYKALHVLNDNIDIRLDLATLLEEEDREEEAILVLSPPKSESTLEITSYESESWWLDERIKLKLCHIYRTKGRTEAFVESIFFSVLDSLLLESAQQKVKARKKLSKSELSRRAKVLDDHGTDSLFLVKSLASSTELTKASRAKKLLQEMAALKEEKKAAALAAGLDWESDDSDEDYTPQLLRKLPLPNILKDDEHHRLIVDLCKGLISLQRFSEAMEVINLTLKLASNSIPKDKQDELRTIGAQIPYNIADPTSCWDYVRHMIFQNPRSFAAWNSYYKVVSRLKNRHTTYSSFLHRWRLKQKDSIPPIIITGHQHNSGSHHQDAAREYLEAYKLMPDSPLINLCAGSAIIDLAFGHRLQNKHLCVLQGLAFLYNNLRLCENSQESLYNLARAYHHVGLVTLAARYYEKVLALHVKDYPIPKVPTGENPSSDFSDSNPDNQQGYCDLRREAAYNLHLIYKNSGAVNLARQILKGHCTM